MPADDFIGTVQDEYNKVDLEARYAELDEAFQGEFMQPEIEPGDWYMIDGHMGTEWVPVDVVGEIEADPHKCKVEALPPPTNGVSVEYQDGPFPIPAELADYTENDEYWTLERVTGFGCRLSAPGYLDCTDWTVVDTEEEAIEHLLEMYAQ